MDKRFQYSAYRYFFFWSILSSLALTVCTLTDATLVGNLVGSDGLAVSNIATPVYLFYALIGVTISVGANVDVSRLLGQSKVEEADGVFHAELTLGLILSLISMLPLLFKKAYFSFLGVTDALYPLAGEYLGVVMWSAPLFIMYHILSSSVRSDSNPPLAAASSAVVIVLNIALDILFMGYMKMGIKGASLSLCIAEGVGAALLLTHFLRKNSLLTLSLKLPSFSMVRSFVSRGFGIGSANIFSAVVMLLFNTLLLSSKGEDGTFFVAVYGIIYTLNTIPCALFDGNSSAIQTVISFLRGEGDVDGVLSVLKRSLLYILVISSILVSLMFVFAPSLVSVFGIRGDGNIERASSTLRIFLFSVIAAGVNTTFTAFWLSIGRSRLSSLISLIRNFLSLIICGLLLIPKFNIPGLSWAYLITEVISLLIVILLSLVKPSSSFLKKETEVLKQSYEKTYPIEKESMEDIAGDIEKITEEWNIDMKKSFMINFISEEILLNIMKFALGDKVNRKEYYISILLMEKGDDLVLRIRDNVSQYNPFESTGDEIDSGVLEFIRKKTKYCDYQRKMVFNYFYTVI